jgi:hypothetical protein
MSIPFLYLTYSGKYILSTIENKQLKNKNMETYVSYIGIANPPLDHPQKRLVFYTTTKENEQQGIFFVRFSPTQFKKDFIEKLVEEGKAIKLNNTIPITKGKMIWLTQEGNICVGENSENNQNFEFLFTQKDLIEARV